MSIHTPFGSNLSPSYVAVRMSTNFAYASLTHGFVYAVSSEVIAPRGNCVAIIDFIFS